MDYLKKLIIKLFKVFKKYWSIWIDIVNDFCYFWLYLASFLFVYFTYVGIAMLISDENAKAVIKMLKFEEDYFLAIIYYLSIILVGTYLINFTINISISSFLYLKKKLFKK